MACRYTLTLNMSLDSGKPADRQGVTELVCTTVAGAALLRTSGAETVRTHTLNLQHACAHSPVRQLPLRASKLRADQAVRHPASHYACPATQVLTNDVIPSFLGA